MGSGEIIITIVLLIDNNDRYPSFLTGYYLKYNLPLKYAARTDEVRWEWRDGKTGRLCHKELIGGGKNSDLDY